jgi:hypothetical protein
MSINPALLNTLASPLTTAALDVAKGAKAGVENSSPGTTKPNKFLNNVTLMASGLGLGAFALQTKFASKDWAPMSIFQIKHVKSQMAVFLGVATFVKEMTKEKKDPAMLALSGGSVVTGGASLALDMFKFPTLEPKDFVRELGWGKHALASKNGLAIVALTTYLMCQTLGKGEERI